MPDPTGAVLLDLEVGHWRDAACELAGRQLTRGRVGPVPPVRRRIRTLVLIAHDRTASPEVTATLDRRHHPEGRRQVRHQPPLNPAAVDSDE